MFQSAISSCKSEASLADNDWLCNGAYMLVDQGLMVFPLKCGVYGEAKVWDIALCTSIDWPRYLRIKVLLMRQETIPAASCRICPVVGYAKRLALSHPSPWGSIQCPAVKLSLNLIASLIDMHCNDSCGLDQHGWVSVHAICEGNQGILHSFSINLPCDFEPVCLGA